MISSVIRMLRMAEPAFDSSPGQGPVTARGGDSEGQSGERAQKSTETMTSPYTGTLAESFSTVSLLLGVPP